MDKSIRPAAAIKALLPKAPLMLKTTALHTLGLTPAAWKLDLRDDLLIAVVRSFLEDTENTAPILKQQRMSMKDPGVKGRMWISKVVMPVPQSDSVRQSLFAAIDQTDHLNGTYAKPICVPVEAEWTGYRPDVAKDAPDPAISDAEKYNRLLAASKNDSVVLYFHGGAHYLMDPCTHRGSTVLLSKLTGGRVLSVRYRLSPQHPFPSALLDALISYLFLLFPPPDTVHNPVPASKVVFAGDSAGGNLAMSLLLLVKQIQNEKLSWFGREVTLALPAGIAVSSPWLDVTRSLPSIETNAQYDYLPPPSKLLRVKYPPDDVWPASPPREEMYCNGDMMCHPLVSPLSSASLRGLPPMFILAGQEGMLDEAKAMAAKAAQEGVQVHWEGFEAMPHHFVMVLPHLKQTKLAYTKWAEFIKAVTAEPESVKTQGWFTESKSLKRKEVDVKDLSGLTDAQVRDAMTKAMHDRIKLFKESSNPALFPPLPKL